MPGRYSIYPFVSAGCTLRQLDSVSYASNQQKAEIIPGGTVDRMHIAVGFAAPVFTLTTRDLLQAFTNLSPASGLRTTSAIIYAQKRADAGTFVAGAFHRSYTCALVDIIPISISASQTDTDGAVLTCEVHVLFDGTNEPVVLAQNVDLTAVTTPLFNSRYFMGEVWYGPSAGRVQLPNVERVEINFGLGYDKKGFNGSAYPTEGSVIRREPTISITTSAADAELVKNIFSRGCEDDGGTGLRVYFQRGAGCDDRVPKATADHMRFTFPYYEWGTEAISFQGNDDGSFTHTFRARGTSSTNGAMTVSSAVAITN